MPIEVNKVTKSCPKCLRPTLFSTSKGEYFCTNCMESFPKEDVQEHQIIDQGLNSIEKLNTTEPVPELGSVQ